MEFGTFRRRAAALTLVLLAGACAPVRPGPAGVPELGVRSFIDVRHMCALGVSPPIAVAAAPAGTARYRVRIVNVSVLFGATSDFEVAAGPGGIAEGALEGYRAPCPGETQLFSYRFEVLALDAPGNAIGYGQTTVSAISTTRTLSLPADLRPGIPSRSDQSP